MSAWIAFDDGRSIGKVSAEGGVILRDDEHEQGARITLKRGASHISISCNIYGKMDHTRFFKTVSEAEREYNPMKKNWGRSWTISRKRGTRSKCGWRSRNS
jgi:hypothetical protein